MKKNILLSTVVGTFLLLTGCGNDKDTDTAPSDVIIEYKTSGTYDLSNYIVSTKSQNNNYVHKIYKNNKGEKKYDKTPDTTTYSTTKFENNNTTILEYFNDILDTTYTIQADKIIEIDNEDNESVTVARYAENGTYISKHKKTYLENGINFSYVGVCKVSNHTNSKEINGKTYNDIIEVTCNTSSSSPKDAKLNGVPYSYETEIEMVSLFAKDQSMILETIESCTDVTVNTTTDKTCEKEIVEITRIN